MQKISSVLLGKMIAGKLSSLEIDFLLLIGRIQDDTGLATGVYYRDVTKKLKCSNQQFYNILRSLAQKELIVCRKSSYYDYDIQILENDFSNPEAYQKGYISLKKGMFCEKFRSLKAGEKLLAMELLRRQEIQYRKIQKNSLCFKVSTVLKIFGTMLGVTARVLRGYLKHIMEWFSVGVKDGKYYITPKKAAYEEPFGTFSDQAVCDQNIICTICHRNRIQTDGYNQDAVKDTAELLTQYRAIAEHAGIDLVDAIRVCILRSVDKTKDTFVAKGRRLEQKLVHKLLKIHLLPKIPETGMEA